TNEQRLRKKRQELLAIKSILLDQPNFWQWHQLWNKHTTHRLARRLIEQIARLEQNSMPEYFLYYNPWPDHFAHFKGPFSDEILSPSGELNRLDYWLSRFTNLYAQAGIDKRTLFGMAGDHGLTPIYHVLNPEVEVFDGLRDEGIDFKVVKISSDEGEGPKLNNQLAPPTMKGIDVVVASTAGGNYMLDLFIDQDRFFTRQPLYKDLLSIKPLANQGMASPVNIIDEIYIRLSESLDYMVVRETENTIEGGEVRLMGKRHGQVATGRIKRLGKRIFYQYEHADLLDTHHVNRYASVSVTNRQLHSNLLEKCHVRKAGGGEGALESKPSTWCAEEDWRLLASFTDRPDSVVQLAHIYDTDRAGTINLFPRQGI
ncbi:MAG: alkaline phosphatase family protein, partial [Gammaproteobacteria bacterium]|nr:alkaline phosphatase family protein [Gammaproteobacteria bacterium]